MDVTLIAGTRFAAARAKQMTDDVWDYEEGFTDADLLTEFAGRACYQSWNKPNPATAENRDYLANVIKQGHFSIFEHANFTFYVEGVSRALTHELVRHRHLSFSQLSQRFVAEDTRNAEPVIPPAIRGDEDAEDTLNRAYWQATQAYEELVNYLQFDKGLPRKQAREAARAVLPNAQETKIVVTGNLRAWREVIARRIDPSADAEIQEFARQVLNILKIVAPHAVQDIHEPEA